METVYIHGGIALQGQVKIQGSKNAVLPILAGTLLVKGTCVIENCPRLKDVYLMQTLLKSLGCLVSWENNSLKVNAEKVELYPALSGMPTEAVRGMRSSVILLGALLGRVGAVFLEYPGGCVIGKRPIDMHLSALAKMGAEIVEHPRGIYASAKRLAGTEITLHMPSVGATENVILAAACAEGDTVLHGAAREPEIVCLCDFLNACGADITGGGTRDIRIHGKEKLTGCHFRVPGDRIVAGTYLCACMAAGGEVLLYDAPAGQMEAFLQTAGRMGALIQENEEGLYIQMEDRPKAVGYVETEPYPGFPTDMQSLFLTVCAVAEGESVLKETIFENRFHTLSALKEMGAKIEQEDSRQVRVQGVESLRGSTVSATELRGGAALVIAGAAAEGSTAVDGGRFIERGYENICRDLRELGVRIYGV